MTYQKLMQRYPILWFHVYQSMYMDLKSRTGIKEEKHGKIVASEKAIKSIAHNAAFESCIVLHDMLTRNKHER